jgi:hypothetical protein
MEHNLYTTANHNCDPDLHCNICDGGLSLCMICGGAEGALPTHCPGVKMTSDQIELVYDGKLDYIEGQWVKNPPPRRARPSVNKHKDRLW